jgi:exoribonuclease R
MLAIRRAGRGASYAPYQAGIVPRHAAVAATYAHATAPLRRLADRYVVCATLAVANGRTLPEAAALAFPKLPPIMAQADALAGQIERAVIDLAEAVMLEGSEGSIFDAVVTDIDERGARIQLRDQPVVARVAIKGVQPGDPVSVRLVSTDPERRQILFEAASPS